MTISAVRREASVRHHQHNEFTCGHARAFWKHHPQLIQPSTFVVEFVARKVHGHPSVVQQFHKFVVEIASLRGTWIVMNLVDDDAWQHVVARLVGRFSGVGFVIQCSGFCIPKSRRAVVPICRGIVVVCIGVGIRGCSRMTVVHGGQRVVVGEVAVGATQTLNVA